MENKPDKNEIAGDNRVTGLFLHLVSRDLGEPFTAFRNRFNKLADEANP